MKFDTSLLSKYVIIFQLLIGSFQAMQAPLEERGQELELAVNFFQFNRDVDDEEVGYVTFTHEVCYRVRTGHGKP